MVGEGDQVHRGGASDELYVGKPLEEGVEGLGNGSAGLIAYVEDPGPRVATLAGEVEFPVGRPLERDLGLLNEQLPHEFRAFACHEFRRLFQGQAGPGPQDVLHEQVGGVVRPHGGDPSLGMAGGPFQGVGLPGDDHDPAGFVPGQA